VENIVKTGVLPGQTPPEAPSPTSSEDPTNAGMLGAGDDMEIDDEDKPGANFWTNVS
jgi:hypothetical protein